MRRCGRHRIQHPVRPLAEQSLPGCPGARQMWFCIDPTPRTWRAYAGQEREAGPALAGRHSWRVPTSGKLPGCSGCEHGARGSSGHLKWPLCKKTLGKLPRPRLLMRIPGRRSGRCVSGYGGMAQQRR